MDAGNFKSTKSLLSTLKELYVKADNSNQDTKDGFVMVQNEATWTTLFVQSFLFNASDFDEREANAELKNHVKDDGDDMLFFVKRAAKGKKDEVLVYRKVAKNLPGIGDPHFNWEETVYLNLILHELEYTLTCTVCTRLEGNELKIHEKASIRVYASPHARRMDSKGESADQSYPYIFYMIDSFDDVFSRLYVQDSEMVCVELVAKYNPNNLIAVVFSGSVVYKDLKRVFDSKASLGSKMAKKMSLGWMLSSEDHTEFITMRGPKGKGYAEMAISEYKTSDYTNGAKPISRSHSDTKVSDTMRLCTCARRISRSDDAQISNRCSRCGERLSDIKEVPNVQEKSTSGTNNFRSRKQSHSLRLRTHLTFVKLPWKCIMKDVLDTQQKPLFYKG